MLKMMTSTNLAVKPAAPKPLTPAQERSAVVLATCAAAWRTLSDVQLSGWNELGKVWSPGKKSPASGFACFQSLNMTLLQTGTTTLLLDAPQVGGGVAQLPAFTITGLRSGGATGAFSLQVQSSAYTGGILVAATPPLSAGTTQFDATFYRSLEALSGLSAGSTDLTAAYTARFSAPNVGTKIGVQLTPITPNGFRGIVRTAIITIGIAPGKDKLTLSKK